MLNFFVLQDYEGEPGDVQQGKDYFRSRFTKLSRKSGQAREREIYVQYVFFPRLSELYSTRPNTCYPQASRMQQIRRFFG